MGHDAEQPGACAAEPGHSHRGGGGARLLAEAVTAYRQALEVFTREQLPQAVGQTQNNLGNTLKEQGIRTERGGRGTPAG